MPVDTPDLADIDPDVLKAAVSAALRENRDWLRELIQDALVSCAEDEAVREAEAAAALTGPHAMSGAARGVA